MNWTLFVWTMIGFATGAATIGWLWHVDAREKQRTAQRLAEFHRYVKGESP